jgi:hypothetical protein
MPRIIHNHQIGARTTFKLTLGGRLLYSLLRSTVEYSLIATLDSLTPLRSPHLQ